MKITSRNRILVVDDEPQILGFLDELFRSADWEVHTASSGAEGIDRLERERFDVVLTDLKMPGTDGIELLRVVKKIQPEAEVVLMTGYATVDTAIEAMRSGAFHYLTKPFQGEEVLNLAGKACDRKRLRQENLFLKAESRGSHLLNAVIGTSPEIRGVLEKVERLAETDSPVLFVGERGAGKQFFARILHFHSPRSNHLFVPVHCAGVSEDFLLRDLFGYAAGAFGQAILPHPGKISLADHGTLFLSGIESAGEELQQRILGLLSRRSILPVGGSEEREVDIRLVAATADSLEDRAAKGSFSAELMKALSPGTVALPSLRERTEDIPLLLHHFLFDANRIRKKPLRGFSQMAMDALCAYPWPGNVRELEEFVQTISARKKQGSVVDAADLPHDILYVRRPRSRGGATSSAAPRRIAERSVEELESPIVLQALALAEGDREKAAALLHIDLATFEALLLRAQGAD
ncbi:MAG: sigma-54 dependent transcriptional regulator [Deltaproteobacteria bacterium]